MRSIISASTTTTSSSSSWIATSLVFSVHGQITYKTIVKGMTVMIVKQKLRYLSCQIQKACLDAVKRANGKTREICD